MKNIPIHLVTCILLIFSIISCNSQSNEVAKESFLKNINLLKRSISEKDFNLKDVPKIIEEMETLTSIPSGADGNYFGRLKPLKTDIIKWEEWYKKNSELLYFDDKDKKIKVKTD